jgi:hypothetical protein
VASTSILASGSLCTAGTHVVAVTYTLIGGGETLPSASSAPVTCDGSHFTIEVILNFTQTNVSGVKIYMSKANTATPLFLAATSASYTRVVDFDVADASLTVAPPTTASLITVMKWHSSNVHDTDGTTPLPGLQLFPNETADSNDFTLTKSRAFTNLLQLADTSNTSLRGFGVSYVCLGALFTEPCATGQWNQFGLSQLSGIPIMWSASSSNDDGSTHDTRLYRLAAGKVKVTDTTGTTGTGTFNGNYEVVSLRDSTTAPTIASGGCTSPAVTHSNGTAAFLLTLGTACTGVKTITLTLPTATHFWACNATNNTSDVQQQSNVIVARATSATAVVLTNYGRVSGVQTDFTASDTVLVSCAGE